MNEITAVGLDLAKRVFQVHAADREGRAVSRKRLRRSHVLSFFAKLPACLIGLEACAGSHFWARELQALGHEVRLIPRRNTSSLTSRRTRMMRLMPKRSAKR